MGFATALIVDDSKLARVTLKKKLEAHGLDVQAVDSAAEAFKALASSRPDIIFMDHLMPDVDGFEATRQIRQMFGFEEIPIVMCTGKDHDGYLDEALSIGANFILSKPPVDEALDAILATGEAVDESFAAVAASIEEETMPVATDVADFLSGHDELAAHPPVAEPDLAPMPETDVADFMEELPEEVGGLEEVAVAGSGVQGGITAADIERICRELLAVEKNSIINQVLAALPTPALPEVSAVTADQVAEICEDLIANERNAIIHDVLASVPAPAIPDMSELRSAGVDMESVLSTVNATVSHQLAVNASSMKNALSEQVIEALEATMGDRVAEVVERDIQSLLDLRLNVMMTEKAKATEERLAQIEQAVNEKLQLATNSADMLFSSDAPVKLASQRVDVSDKISDLYEKVISLQFKLKISQGISVAAVAVAVAAIVLGLRH